MPTAIIRKATKYGAVLAGALLALNTLAPAKCASHPLTEPSEKKRTNYRTKSGEPVRMRGRLQYNQDSSPSTTRGAAASAASAGGTKLDYDLYMRTTKTNDFPGAPGNGSAWNAWTSRILTDVHAQIEKDLTVPGYADFVVTAQPDGSCTAQAKTIMGGPLFREKALTLIENLNANRTLKFLEIPNARPYSFKLGAGAFHPQPTEGHFWCGIGGELPHAAAQIKKRYSQYQE